MCIESQVPASASNPHPLSTQHPALSTQHSTKKREISQYHRGDSREIRGLTGGRFGGAFPSTQNSQPHQIQPLTNFPHFQSVFFFARPPSRRLTPHQMHGIGLSPAQVPSRRRSSETATQTAFLKLQIANVFLTSHF